MISAQPLAGRCRSSSSIIRRDSGWTRLPELPPVGIGGEAEVTDCDLSLIGDMGSRPGDELQVVHPLYLFGAFPIPIADLGSGIPSDLLT